MADKKRRVVWFIVAGCVAGVAVVLSRFPATNVAATRPDHDDPLLRTRHYAASLEQVHTHVQALIPALRTYGQHWVLASGTKTVAPDGATTYVMFAVVPVLCFSDDFVVTLHGDGNSVTVNARSASRVGKGDFGENRRHVIQFLAALDAAVLALPMRKP